MRVDIIVPNFDKSSDSITLSSWYKQPGDKVAKGEIIADAETDTISCGITASFDCILAKILIPRGYEMDPGTKIAVVEKDLNADTSKMKEESDYAISEYKKTHKKTQEEVEEMSLEPKAAEIIKKSNPEPQKQESQKLEHKKSGIIKPEEPGETSSFTRPDVTLPSNRAAKLSEAMKHSMKQEDGIINAYNPSFSPAKNETPLAKKELKSEPQKTELPGKSCVPKETVETPKAFGSEDKSELNETSILKTTLDSHSVKQRAEKTLESEKDLNEKSNSADLVSHNLISEARNTSEITGPEDIKLDPILYEQDLPKTLFLRRSKDIENEDDATDEVNVSAQKTGIQKATGFISELFHAIQENFFDSSGESNINFERESQAVSVKKSVEDPKEFIDKSANEVANDDAGAVRNKALEVAYKLNAAEISNTESNEKTAFKKPNEILNAESNAKLESERTEDLDEKDAQTKNLKEAALKSEKTGILSKLGIKSENFKANSLLSKLGLNNKDIKVDDEEIQPSKDEKKSSLLTELGVEEEAPVSESPVLKTPTAPSYRIVEDDIVVEKVIVEKVGEEVIVKGTEVLKSPEDDGMVKEQVVAEKVGDEINIKRIPTDKVKSEISVETKNEQKQEINNIVKAQKETVINQVLNRAVLNENKNVENLGNATFGNVSKNIKSGEKVGGNMAKEFDNNKDIVDGSADEKIANILKEAEENANLEAQKLKDEILAKAQEEAMLQAEELKNKIFSECEEQAMKEANDMRNQIVQGSISEAENTKQELINNAILKAQEEVMNVRQKIFESASQEAKTQSLSSINDALIEARELAKNRAGKLSTEIIQKALDESKAEAKDIKRDVIHSATKHAAKESQDILRETIKKAKITAQHQAEKIINSAIQITSKEAERLIYDTMYLAKGKAEAKWGEIVEKMSQSALKEAKKLVQDTIDTTKTQTEKVCQDIIDSVKETAIQESKELIAETIKKAKEDSKIVGKDLINSISLLASKEAENFIKETVINAKTKSEEAGYQIIANMRDIAQNESERLIKVALENAEKSTEYKSKEIINTVTNIATYKAEEIANAMISRTKEKSENISKELIEKATAKAQKEADNIVSSVSEMTAKKAEVIVSEALAKAKRESDETGSKIIDSTEDIACREAQNIVLQSLAKVRELSEIVGREILSSIKESTQKEAQNIVNRSLATAKETSEQKGQEIIDSIEEAATKEAQSIVTQSLISAKEKSERKGQEIISSIEEAAKKEAHNIVAQSLEAAKEKSELASKNISDAQKEVDDIIQNTLLTAKSKAAYIETSVDSIQKHATEEIGNLLEETLLKIKLQADDLEKSFCESTQSAISSIADLASKEAKNMLKGAIDKAQSHYDKRAKEVIDVLSYNKHINTQNTPANISAKESTNEKTDEHKPDLAKNSTMIKGEPLNALLGALTKNLHSQAQDLLDDYKNHAANFSYEKGVMSRDKLDEYTEKIRLETQHKSSNEGLKGCTTSQGYCIPENNDDCNNCTLNKFGACVSNEEANLIQKLMDAEKNGGTPEMYADNWNKPQGFDSPTDEKVKIDEFRQRIYENRKNAIDPSVIATLSEEVDMSSVLALARSFGEKFAEKHNTRLGFTPFFISGAISALKKYKMFNAHITNDTIVYKNAFDISIITCGNDGLLAPVLRHADSMSIADIEKSMIALSKRAVAGELSLEEVSGGTFTVVNAGIYGSTLGSDLLTPPQVATLSVHKMHERPVATRNGIEVRPILYISLSYDQRAADKKLASEFLNTVKEYVENPGWNSLGL